MGKRCRAAAASPPSSRLSQLRFASYTQSLTAFTACGDNNAYAWDLASGKCVRSFEGKRPANKPTAARTLNHPPPASRPHRVFAWCALAAHCTRSSNCLRGWDSPPMGYVHSHCKFVAPLVHWRRALLRHDRHTSSKMHGHVEATLLSWRVSVCCPLPACNTCSSHVPLPLPPPQQQVARSYSSRRL